MPLDSDFDKKNPNQSTTKPPQQSNSDSTCEQQQIYTVGFEEDIKPFFSTYCKECHSLSPLNWMDYEIVKTKKEKFFLRVFDLKNMPPSYRPQPTNQELDLFKIWLNLDLPKSKFQTPSCTTPIPDPSPTPTPPVLPAPTITPTPTPTSTPSPIVTPYPEPETTPTPLPTPIEKPVSSYKKNIKPLIMKYCFSCHNWGELNWGEYQKLKVRAENGVLYNRLILKKDMPMEGFPKPTDDELLIFEKWISEGAME